MTLPDKYILDLPEIGDEKSPETPKYTWLEMAEMCEKCLPIWNVERFAEEEDKIFEPFVWKD